MSQLFFNISALANHLIEQSETPSPHKIGVNTEFDNFLKISAVNEKIAQQRRQIPDIELLFSILGSVPAVAMDMDQSISLPFNSYTEQEGYGINTAKLPSHMLNIGLPAEVYTPESKTVSELKEILASQTVPLTLDLKKSTTQNNILIDRVQDGKSADQIHNNNPLKALQLPNSIKVNFQGNTSVNLENIDTFPEIIQSGKTLATHEGTRILVGAVNPELNAIESSPVKNDVLTDGGSRYSRIIFTADQLFKDNSQSTSVKVFDETDKVVDLKMPAARLRELVEKYPDKILIEVKSSSSNSTKLYSDNKFIDQQAMRAAQPVIQSNETIKSVIFDLRLLLSKGGSENVNVIQKTINGDIQGVDATKVSVPENHSLNNNTTEPKTGFEYNPKQKAEQISLVPNKPELSSHINKESDNKDILAKSPAQIKLTKEDGMNNNREYNEKSNEHQLTDNKNASEIKNPIRPGKSTSSSSVFDDSVFKLQSGIKTQTLSTDVKVENPISDEPATSRVAENIDKIIDQLKSKLVANNKNTQIIIKLKPESLGRISVNLKYDGEKIKALFRVENPEVKYALDTELPKLKANWKIDEYRVEMNNSESNSGSFSGNRNNPSRAEHNRLNHTLLSNDESLNNKPVTENRIKHSANLLGGAIDLIA